MFSGFYISGHLSKSKKPENKQVIFTAISSVLIVSSTEQWHLTLHKSCRQKYPLINKFNGFLSTVLARAISYIIQLVSNHKCSIFSSLLSVLGVNPKGGFESYVERRREAILFEGMWRTCFSSYIRRKKETRTTGRRRRYTLCKSVLSNWKTFILGLQNSLPHLYRRWNSA
jgi:hypothetical protein